MTIKPALELVYVAVMENGAIVNVVALLMVVLLIHIVEWMGLSIGVVQIVCGVILVILVSIILAHKDARIMQLPITKRVLLLTCVSFINSDCLL